MKQSYGLAIAATNAKQTIPYEIQTFLNWVGLQSICFLKKLLK